ETAIASRRWDEAIAACRAALLLDKGNSLLNAKVARAEMEKQNEALHRSFEQARAGNDWKGAIAIYDSIPEGSVYRADAKEPYAGAKKEYVETLLATARQIPLPRCAEASSTIDEVVRFDPANAEAMALRVKCSARDL